MEDIESLDVIKCYSRSDYYIIISKKWTKIVTGIVGTIFLDYFESV